MTERPDEPTPDGSSGAGDRSGFEAIEAQLVMALEARAGGPLAGAGEPEPTRDDDERLGAIEAAMGTDPSTRSRMLAVAAAAVVVLLIGSVALTRTGDEEEVRVEGVPSTTVAPEPTTGTAPVPAPALPPPTTVEAGPQPTVIVETDHVDPANFTYPSSVCAPHLDSDQATMPSAPFTLIDGTAMLPLTLADGRAVPDGVHIGLTATTHGDVAGRGRDQLIVTLSCGFNQSDGVWPSVVVIAPDGDPMVLGSITRSGVETTYDEVDPITGEVHERTRVERLVWVRPSPDGLQIRWNQNGGMGTADLVDQREVTVTYRWDGRTFVPIDESDVVIIPAQPFGPPVPTTVESVDVPSD